MELARGLPLEGKVVDLAGRPVPGVIVLAQCGDPLQWAGFAPSKADGSFRFEHLVPRLYTLASQPHAGAFAMRAGVSPGDKDLVVTLRPGGRVHLTVLDEKGAPVSTVVPYVTAVDGVATRLSYATGRTDPQGFVDFAAPAGVVEVEVKKGKQAGKGRVEVDAGGIAVARVVLGATAGP